MDVTMATRPVSGRVQYLVVIMGSTGGEDRVDTVCDTNKVRGLFT